MLKNPEIPTTNLSTGDFLAAKTMSPAVKKGSVSVNARLRHLSLLLYTIPSEMAAKLIPAEFKHMETNVGGRKMAWLSVVSFMDEGSRTDGQRVFEQTEYRLHVTRDGQPAQWLIGTSLGSLAAVGMRNMWPMPWHLSAMEFQVSYDSTKGKYAHYHLQTQSQWENASWEIADSGESYFEDSQDIPASVFADAVTTFYERRDGSIGSIMSRNSGPNFTRAVLRKGNSDMLSRLGLLSKTEINYPVLALTQKDISCQYYSPTILGPASRTNADDDSQLIHFAYAS